jgi:hypothetical protein
MIIHKAKVQDACLTCSDCFTFPPALSNQITTSSLTYVHLRQGCQTIFVPGAAFDLQRGLGSALNIGYISSPSKLASFLNISILFDCAVFIPVIISELDSQETV